MRLPRFYRKNFLLRHAWTRALYLHQDVDTKFWDGQTRHAPRRICRLFKFWREWAELRAESDLVFSSYRGGDVVDVGAAEGWYGCLLAPLTPKMFLAVEPDFSFYSKCLLTFSYLQSTFPKTSFVALPQACGNGNPLRFTYQYGHISQAGPDTPPEAGSLPGLPLDRIVEFFGLQPGFLKVDVEGFEQEVLEGAKETVVRHRPILLVEMHKFQAGYPGACAWLEAWLNSLGYLGQKFFESDGITRTLWKPHPTGNSHIVSK